MADLKIGRLMMGICQTNCYFVYEEGKNQVIFIDPADKGEYIYDRLQERGFSVAAILLTHGHFDHILAVDSLKNAFQVPVYAAEAEKEILLDPDMNLSLQVGTSVTVEADKWLKDGEKMHCPKCGGTVFCATAHVTQDWQLNELGTFQASLNDCVE